MPDVLRIAAGVATPLSLLGLIAALAYFIYSRRLKHREAIIKLLPEEDRAKEVDELLSRYGLDASNLTREQKYQLLLDEMGKRYKLAQYKLIVSACVFIICFAVAAYAFIRLGGSQAPSSAIQVDNSGATVGRDLITTINPPVDTTKKAVEELNLLLHTRANSAFAPISFALTDKRYDDERRKVVEFKEQWVSLEIALNEAIVNHRFSQAFEICKKMKQHGSSNVADWISYYHGPNPSGIFFKKLPQGLADRLRDGVPELKELLALFEY